MSIAHRWSATAVVGVVAVVMMLSGCTGVPADVDGTLRDVQGGDLRVGITHNPPWTDTTDPDKPSGQEVRLDPECDRAPILQVVAIPPLATTARRDLPFRRRVERRHA